MRRDLASKTVRSIIVKWERVRRGFVGRLHEAE
jgi:hypothetical protein